MKIKNRALSFVIIALIYIIASIIGVIAYLHLSINSIWLKLLIADCLATVVTFVFSLIFKNASVYDPYWSVQPIVILSAFAIGQNLSIIKILLLVVVFLWGLRLTVNWAYTFKNFEYQDWRYSMLKQKTGKFYPVVNFLGIHMFPTLVVYACTLPAVYLLVTNVTANAFSYIFLAVSFLATILQGVSDCQMHYFKKHKTPEQRFIKIGLWKYSRHPNYLGEILMWWGIALCSVLTLQARWYLLFGAIVNTLMFLIVSIPMADKRQSQKEGFAEYKKHTNMLLPIKFKK